MRDADARGARLTGANLTKADLRGAIFAPLPLSATRQTAASFERTNVRYALAQGADMTGAVLDGADLRGCDLTDARLSGASIRDVQLYATLGFELARAAA